MALQQHVPCLTEDSSSDEMMQMMGGIIWREDDATHTLAEPVLLFRSTCWPQHSSECL
jgi:hypothetical protein